MADPITLGGLGAAIVAAAPFIGKAIKSAATLVMSRLDSLEAKLHSDHEANQIRVQAIQEDITEIKVDVAVVKTEVNNMKERT